MICNQIVKNARQTVNIARISIRFLAADLDYRLTPGLDCHIQRLWGQTCLFSFRVKKGVFVSRIALVTGAGRGIGRATAILLAKQGFPVVITSRTQSELDEVAQSIESNGGKVLAIQCDLSDRSQPVKLIDRIEQSWGPVEVLINNAGIGSSQNPRPIVDFDDDFWDLTFLVNVTVPYLLTKRVLPNMIKAGWGRIVNIGSINSKMPSLHSAAYVSSKHAIGGLTKVTAKEVMELGITCNAICPGVIATRMNDKRIEYDARRLGKSTAQLESESTLLGRRLVPDEVAPAIAFLVSDGAAVINGQLLNVCAGMLMD